MYQPQYATALAKLNQPVTSLYPKTQAMYAEMEEMLTSVTTDYNQLLETQKTETDPDQLKLIAEDLATIDELIEAKDKKLVAKIEDEPRQRALTERMQEGRKKKAGLTKAPAPAAPAQTTPAPAAPAAPAAQAQPAPAAAPAASTPAPAATEDTTKEDEKEKPKKNLGWKIAGIVAGTAAGLFGLYIGVPNIRERVDGIINKY